MEPAPRTLRGTRVPRGGPRLVTVAHAVASAVRIAAILIAIFVATPAAPGAAPAGGPADFRRGDANRDGTVDAIFDADYILTWLFTPWSGGPLACVDALDVDDDGAVNITDVVELLQWQFEAGATPPPPGPWDCGPDPTVDLNGCVEYETCDVPIAPDSEPGLVVELPAVLGAVDTEVQVTVTLDNTTADEVRGWALGVCHDPSLAAVTQVEPAADLVLLDPDYAVVNLESDGWTAAVLVSYLWSTALEPAEEIALYTATYSLLELGTTELALCDTLGDPPVTTAFLTWFPPLVPECSTGSIEIVADPPFRRGDVNGDGKFDIADPIFGLLWLFIPGSPPPLCPDAGDADDDGSLDIGDAVALLAALFTPASPLPPAPGPYACGPDPTADGLGCGAPPSCP